VPNPPPDGPYRGELVALDIAPLVTPFVEWLTSFLMPWRGKFLIASESRGDNIFSAKWRAVLGLLYPFYRGNRDYGSDSFRAFIFETSTAVGKGDADRACSGSTTTVPTIPRSLSAGSSTRSSRFVTACTSARFT